MLKLIGHRGLPQRYPENTLISMQKALDAGADAVECDVQVGKNGVPYLFHDDSVNRVSAIDGLFSDLSTQDFENLSVHEPIRFGEKFFPTKLNELRDMCGLMSEYKHARVFVEIKSESFSYASREHVLEAVVHAVKPILPQVTIISFDLPILSLARSFHKLDIGWVVSTYDSENESKAQNLKPNFLFCDVAKLPQGALWLGNWAWAIYDIVSSAKADELYRQGVDWIESWDVQTLKRGLSMSSEFYSE